MDERQKDYAEVWVDDGNENGGNGAGGNENGGNGAGDPPGTPAHHRAESDPNQMGASIPDYQPAPGHPEAMAARTDQIAPRANAPIHAEPAIDTENDFIASARRAAAAADAQGVSAAPVQARQNRFSGGTASSRLPQSKRQRPLLVMAAVGLLYSRLKTTSGAVPPLNRPAQIAPQSSAPQQMVPSGTRLPADPKPSAPQSSGAKKQHSERMQYPSAPAPRSAPVQPKTVTKLATPHVTRASIPASSASIAAQATQALNQPKFNQPLSTATVLASLPQNAGLDAGAEPMSGVSVTIKEPAARTAPRAATPTLVPPSTQTTQPAPMALPKRAPAATKTARRTPPAGSVDSALANEIKFPANAIQTGMPPATIGPQSLRMAAARGNPAAQVAIASRYAKGTGIAKNLKKAAEWYGRAASQGYAPAQYRLAALHERGQGVKKDIGMARTWYRRAAELGNVRAMHNLAVLYTRAEGKGADYVAAKNWFYQAARHGLADSQFNLGILYESGLGARKNIAEAYKWFTLAARQGDKESLKRREVVRPRLSAKSLSAVERVLKSWHQVPVKDSANRTGPPKGGWQNARTENISAGSDPALIARAQFLLNKLGYDAGAPDGKMGPKTAEAILRFEGRTGKAKTGKVTPVLLRRLAALSG
jgi:localization factor PodJL